jgi:DNA repair exonuclease SbcCD ATPase subunit
VPTFKLTSATVRGWSPIADATVEFPAHGVVLVLGENTGGAGRSVGAGKTSLGLALARCLTGLNRAGDAHMLQQRTQGKTHVTVNGTFADKPMCVELGYKHAGLSKTGEGLRFTLGDVVTMRADVNATRRELAATLGLSSQLAGWTTFVDGDKIKFGDLSHADALDLVMDALRQPNWTDAQRQAREALQAAARNLEISQANLRDLTAERARVDARLATATNTLADEEDKLASARELYDGRRQAATWFDAGWARYATATRVQQTTTRTALTAARAALTAAQTARDDADDAVAVTQESLRKALDDAQARVNANEDQLRRLTDAMTARERELGRMRQQHRTSTDKCPTCNQTWRSAEEKRAHLATELDLLQTALNQATADRDACLRDNTDAHDTDMQTIVDITSQLKVGRAEALAAPNAAVARATASVQAAERKVQHADDVVQHADGRVRVASRRLSGVKPLSDAQVAAARASCDERRGQLADLDVKLTAAATDIADWDAATRVRRYWVDGFGPGGIQNMVLQGVLPQLNATAAAVSQVMTRGTVGVTFHAARTLASGSARPELEVKVANRHGSPSVNTSSKGESGLINLIIAETLCQVGLVHRRVGWRWFDEVVNNQDDVIRGHIFNYLRTMAAREQILIFVVDHHADAAMYADHVLTAVKDPQTGLTVYRWD